jgi:hypothetical protein
MHFKYVVLTLHAEVSQLKPPKPSVLIDGRFIPTIQQPIHFHNIIYLCVLIEVFCCSMSGNALDCKILTSASHLKPVLWRPSVAVQFEGGSDLFSLWI